MERDIRLIFEILEKYEISIDKYFRMKFSYRMYIYLKCRKILILFLKCMGLFLLCLCLFTFVFVLLIFVLEFLNFCPLHKSVDFLNKEFKRMAFLMFSGNKDNKCLIENGFKELIRDPVKCDFCYNVNKINKLSNLSQNNFLENYAYTGHPIIINDATNDWNARKLFSYKFFQTIYSYSLNSNSKNVIVSDYIFNRKTLSHIEKLSILKNNYHNLDCQFFKYQTNYQSLEEFLSIDILDINNSVPWYVGWSNCDPVVNKILRAHYRNPYFLPALSENHNSDWIFMGYPGYGAKIHIDFVNRPSWQAQLKGKKLWKLKPPHECRLVCKEEIQVILDPGDIIVLDTNLWYHQTEVIGDEISITIGAEYD